MKVILAVTFALFGFFFALNSALAKTYIVPSGKVVEVVEHKKIWREFTLPSGLIYIAEIIVPKAHADDTSLVDVIRRYMLDESEKWGVSPVDMVLIANCESGFLNDAERAITIKGDAGKALGLYQWWQKSWDYYNKVYKTKLDREVWMHQVTMSAKVMADKGLKDWYNCSIYTRTGKWPWKK